MDIILKKAASEKNDSVDNGRKLTDGTTAFLSARGNETTKPLEEHSSKTTDSFPENVLPITSANSEKSTATENDQDDSGFDTGDSSDERKKKWCLSRGRGAHGKKVPQQIKGFSEPLQISPANLNENCVGSGLSGL